MAGRRTGGAGVTWGWSEAPPGDYAKQTFAKDMVAMLDREGIEGRP